MSDLVSVYKNQLKFGSLSAQTNLGAEVVILTNCFRNVAKEKPNSIFSNAEIEKIAECSVSKLTSLSRMTANRRAAK